MRSAYFPAMSQWFLTVVEGNAAGQQVPLDQPLVIGRDEVGPGTLGDDAQLSRRHARVYPLDDGDILIEDLGSTNGTLVNGQRLTAARLLRAGDRITVGKSTLEFKASSQPSPPDASPTLVVAAPGGSSGYGSTGAGAAPAASAGTPTPAVPAASSYGYTPTSGSGSGQRSGGKRMTLGLVGVLLLAAGVGGGFAIGDSGKSSSKFAATSTSIGVRDASGAADITNFKCAPFRNGNFGPGHFRFITSGCEDAKSLVAQFPLQMGTSGGKTVYYVVTDSSSQADALARHVNYAQKLANGVGSPAVQNVTLKNGVIDFPATVDFAPTHVLVAGPNGFPTAKAQPSAVGAAGYSPLIKLPSGIVINAPQIANDTGHADKALKLDMKAHTVLYQETEGRYEDKHVHYASFESGDATAAAIEDVTYAPAFNKLPAPGKDGLKDSAREELVAFVNGPIGITNPGRQGENSVVLDNADPHNILKEVPVLPMHESVGAPEYTPGWDVHFAEWTPASVGGGTRVEVQSTDEVDTWVKMKAVTGPGGKPFGASNITVNCPLISIDVP